jgi:hypothetical protein
MGFRRPFSFWKNAIRYLSCSSSSSSNNSNNNNNNRSYKMLPVLRM